MPDMHEPTLASAVRAAYEGASVIYIASSMRMGTLFIDHVRRESENGGGDLFAGLYPVHVTRPRLDTINVDGGGKQVGSVRFVASGVHLHEYIAGWHGRVFIDPECWPLEPSALSIIATADPTALQQWLGQ